MCFGCKSHVVFDFVECLTLLGKKIKYLVLRNGFEDQPDYTYKTDDLETLKLLQE